MALLRTTSEFLRCPGRCRARLVWKWRPSSCCFAGKSKPDFRVRCSLNGRQRAPTEYGEVRRRNNRRARPAADTHWRGTV